MNNSFLDRSMETVNFNNSNFLEPQFKSNTKQTKMKESNHLDRIFDQTTVNPHFAGNNTRDMKLSFRPETSFDVEKEKKMFNQDSSYAKFDKTPTPTRQKRHIVKEMNCQYCDSYRKKNMQYETMISDYQRKISELTSKINKGHQDTKSKDVQTNDIRREYSKISDSLKQKQKECEILEKKISSIQLEQRDKDKSRIEEEIKKGNEKYYKMVQHYEKIVGELRNETIELNDKILNKPENTKENRENTRHPMLEKLLPVLSNKLGKSKEEIERKLIDYPFPETLTSEELKKILDLYK